jgi:pimeloyl-ACP methyl ester carboxylesterase
VSDLHWIENQQWGGRDFTLAGSQRLISGAVWLPDRVESTTPLVLMGHGASGDRYQAPLPHLARRFVNECQFAVLAMDGPVHGLRKVGDGGRKAFFEEMQRAECIDDMLNDWSAAYRAVCAETGLGQSPTGYFGLSMGTMFGIPLLASDINFAASVVGLCGSTGAAGAIASRLQEDAAAITHPVLFLMQLEDELFPRDGYLDLFDRIASVDKRLHANPGLHPEVPAEEVDCAFQFLAQRLQGKVERRIVNALAQ